METRRSETSCEDVQPAWRVFLSRVMPQRLVCTKVLACVFTAKCYHSGFTFTLLNDEASSG